MHLFRPLLTLVLTAPARPTSQFMMCGSRLTRLHPRFRTHLLASNRARPKGTNPLNSSNRMIARPFHRQHSQCCRSMTYRLKFCLPDACSSEVHCAGMDRCDSAEWLLQQLPRSLLITFPSGSFSWLTTLILILAIPSFLPTRSQLTPICPEQPLLMLASATLRCLCMF